MRISLHTIPQLFNTANKYISLAKKLLKIFFSFLIDKPLFYNNLILSVTRINILVTECGTTLLINRLINYLIREINESNT